jgi:CII-binding regulator of phage lambda lysogenization HflD
MRRWVAACLIVVAALLPVYASPLTVSTDKGSYSPGETVTITIQGSPNTFYGVEVRGPGGQLIALKQVTAGSDGRATLSIGLASDSPTGTYTIVVSGGGETFSKTFTVSAAAAPAPGPAPVSPGAAASSALNTAKFRLAQLSKAISSLNASLAPLGLEGVLANASSALAALSAKLSEAEAKYNAGDYDAAYKLASEVASECSKLLNQLFSASVQALRGVVAEIAGSSNDSLVVSLLVLANRSLDEVSPTYVDSSLASIDLSCKLIMAAGRLADLNAEVGQLASQLNATLTRLNSTLNELARLRSETEVLQARAGELEKERTRLAQRLSELEESLSAAQSKTDSLTAENQQLKSQVLQLEQKAVNLERQVSQANALAAGVSAVVAAIGFAIGYFLARKRTSEESV